MNNHQHSSAAVGHAILDERKRQKLSLDELARRSDVSKGMLSQIEQGKTNPTIAVLYKVAVGLHVEIGRLIPQGKNTPRIWRVVRYADENCVFSRTADCTIRTLSPLDLEKQIEFYELTFGPHGKLASEAHYQGAEEILSVAKGRIRVMSGDNETDLHRGDSVHYAADVPHAITNMGDGEAVAFLIVRWYG
jgi:transcriptional regulator with XRE-family HTH domain